MGLLRAIWHWFEVRLGLDKVTEALKHPVPPEAASYKTGWLYVFGNATMVVFLHQVVTGAILATTYIPSPANAYESLLFINNEVTLGWLLRGMHFYGASAMVVLISLHTARVFLTASYKFPRELNWLTGVALLVLTLAMAFTGQLLRWDQDGIWTVAVATQFAGRVPLIGAEFAQVILAGGSVSGSTLSRFFALHVLIMPLLIFAIIGVHVYLVLYHGISELPQSGQPVDPKTYRSRYQAYLERHGRPYWPDVTSKEIAVGTGVIAIIALLAFIFGPKGPGEPPDPTVLVADPQPDWFFRWYYALLAYQPRGIENFVMVYAPLIIGLVLILLPFVANRGERSPLRRPWAVGITVVTGIMLVVLTGAGLKAPWVPEFATEPLPPEVIGATSGPIYEGAQLFHSEGCQACHSVLGYGGSYGPDLTDVAQRFPPHEITLRIMNGIADMPPYRDTLTLDELNAILAFLHSIEAGPDDEARSTRD
jgi:ubiquinol-cytochrome c reductase cytochrome b subunit